MKKLILLLMVAAALFVVWARYRLYLRDPVASVMRNGVAEPGSQVFINYANDVLIENDHAPLYVVLVQHGQRMGVPASLKCMHFVACLTDADTATLVINDGARVGAMSGKTVNFQDEAGRNVVVTLH